MTEDFIDKNPATSRSIEMRGDQTLADLHCAIFGAFDRDDEHMYEFQVGGARPMDPAARRYVTRESVEYSFGSDHAGLVHRTSIGSLGLKVGDMFGYWFDFGDDWWHRIEVTAIGEAAGEGEYPTVVARQGESPPQYVFEGEEDDEENGEG
jgi:hypothetical protein